MRILLLIFALHFACGDVTKPQSPEIAAGFNAAVSKAKCKGYTQGLSVNDYNIVMVAGELRIPCDGCPGIAVFRLPCAQYCGTEWDQGGFIYSAGQFLAPNTIKLPDNAGAEAAYNEFEHALLYKNNRPEYERTKTHTLGTGHPIIECR